MIVCLLWCVSFVFLKVLFNRNMGNYEKELWKIYVVSMPSAVIKINILGQTLYKRKVLVEVTMPLVWRQPQSYNLVFRCNIKSHIRGYFTTTHNLVDLWPLVKSGGLYKTVVSHLLKWDTIINKSIDPKHITGILGFPLCILNFKESLAFVNLEQIISELQTVE